MKLQNIWSKCSQIIPDWDTLYQFQMTETVSSIIHAELNLQTFHTMKKHYALLFTIENITFTIILAPLDHIQTVTMILDDFHFIYHCHAVFVVFVIPISQQQSCNYQPLGRVWQRLMALTGLPTEKSYITVQTFSIASNNLHFVSTYGVLTILKVNLIEDKRPYIVTEPICVQTTLQYVKFNR